MSHQMTSPYFREKSSDWPRVGLVTTWFNRLRLGRRLETQLTWDDHVCTGILCGQPEPWEDWQGW